MLREATLDDLDQLLAIGRRMAEESPRFGRLQFDAERLAVTLRAAIESPYAFTWVCARGDRVVGCMFAVLTPHWFSPDLTSCDLALFMLPEHRGTLAPARLLNAYATWARGRGAKHILFGVMTGVHVEETVRLCERLGWRRAGVVMEI
jgi:GNAT superfamily N-acetyltransferase